MNGNSLQGDTERCGRLITAKTQMPGHVRDAGCGGGGRARGLGKRAPQRPFASCKGGCKLGKIGASTWH